MAACSSEDDGPGGSTIDSDGDRVADDLGSMVDNDLDGNIDTVDLNNDGVPDGPGIDVNGDGIADGIGIDTNGDGIYDCIDTNLDNLCDTESQLGTGGTGSGGAGTGGLGTGGTGSGGLGTGGGATGGAGSGGAGTGGGGAGTGGGMNVACSINITTSEPAMLMPTVGIVEFSTDLGSPTSAQIDFGKDTNYGMTAPVDMAAPNFHTMLLGMAANTEYHYRITVSNASGSCSSEDQTISAGGLRTGVATPNNVMTTAGTTPGFIGTTSGNSVVIMNHEGEVVWGYTASGGGGGGPGGGLGLFSAKMSWDGKYMYMRDLGPFDAGSGGTIWRVSMDGSEEITLPLTGGHHHDMTVTPDGIAYIAKAQAGQCDQIYLAGHDGSGATPLVNLDAVFGNYSQGGMSAEACHVNAINYLHDAQMFTVSDRERDVIGMVTVGGEPVQTVGKMPNGNNSFTTVIADGATTTWRVQHGHHYYADDKLLVFSNGNFGGGTSRVLHYTISGTSATIDWEYTDAGNSGTQGDVEYLPSGNFLITASMAGNIHEIDANRQLVSSYKFTSNGYTFHRETLYGPPPSR